MHQCIKFVKHSDNEDLVSTKSTSSLELAQRDQTEYDTGNFTYYYEDPTSKTDVIIDLFDSALNYTMLKYATRISNNNFTSNFAGMKGSAIATKQLSELQIEGNSFIENGPVTTYSEMLHSPYYKYLAMGARNLTFNDPLNESCTIYNVTNEF